MIIRKVSKGQFSHQHEKGQKKASLGEWRHHFGGGVKGGNDSVKRRFTLKNYICGRASFKSKKREMNVKGVPLKLKYRGESQKGVHNKNLQLRVMTG